LSGPARKNTTVYDTMLANYRTDPDIVFDYPHFLNSIQGWHLI